MGVSWGMPEPEFNCLMKDDLDGQLYPPIPHETEQEARAYAALRSSQKKCEIRVIAPSGDMLAAYRNGEEVDAEVEQKRKKRVA
jgi:hypothetical protein